MRKKQRERCAADAQGHGGKCAGSRQDALGGLEVLGDGVEVIAEARGDAHTGHNHALQAVDHLDLRTGCAVRARARPRAQLGGRRCSPALISAPSAQSNEVLERCTLSCGQHNAVQDDMWGCSAGRTETGTRPARALGATARAGLVLTAASLLARKLELRSEAGARLNASAVDNTCPSTAKERVTGSASPAPPGSVRAASRASAPLK